MIIVNRPLTKFHFSMHFWPPVCKWLVQRALIIIFHKIVNTTSYNVTLTNLQLNVSMNVNCVRKIEMKVQGFGPRMSHTGPVRIPPITGGNAASTEQSTPRKPATSQYMPFISCAFCILSVMSLILMNYQLLRA